LGRVERGWRALGTVFLGAALWTQPPVSGADFNVTSPGFYFSINGVANNPELTLIGGKTYTFDVNTSCILHPFEILGAPADSLSTNKICSGTITFRVPATGGPYQYICSIHRFGGVISNAPALPPTPPIVRIVSFSVGTNVFLASTGTNGWAVNPEYSTNLTSTNWLSLTILTNCLIGGTNAPGTNQTICRRPSGDSVFIRVRSKPN
jgi:plastocyanin